MARKPGRSTKSAGKRSTSGGKTAGTAAGSRKSSLREFKGVFDLRDELGTDDRAAVVSFFIERGASRSVSVNVAVTNQLIKEGKWPPNDITKVMNAIPYRYDAQSMRNFLDGVARTLAAALPPVKFTWNAAFVTKVLPLSVAALMAEIELASE